MWPLLVALAAATPTIVSQSSSTPYPGLTVREWVLSGPTNRVKIAEVALCADGVEVVATAPPTRRRTPGAWGEDVGVELATNGDFYRTDTTTPVVAGDAVGDGIRWPVAQTVRGYPDAWYATPDLYGWIGFGPDFVEFSHSQRVKAAAATWGLSQGWRPTEVTSELPRGLSAMVSGFPELVVEGTPVTCSSPTATSCFTERSDMRQRHPRTAMGLSADRRTFFLVVVDGRSTSSSGMYGTELADLMHHLGAFVAFNLDGGGSSAMWLRGRGYLNSPSDGSPRPVANQWGVHASGAGAAESCFTWGGCYPTPVPGAEGALFKDMPPGSPAAAEAAILYRAGVTSGCNPGGDLMYCPRCDVTRAQFAALLLRAEGQPLPPAPAVATFSDVPTDHLFFREIEAMAARGITTGCGSGRFCPDDPVTRGQLAAFLRRTLGWARGDGAPTFGDVPADHAFFGDVEALVDHCVTSGCGDGDYCPDAAADRGQAAVFLARAFDLEDSNPCLPEDGDTDTDPSTDPDTDPDPGTDPDTDPDPGTDPDTSTEPDTDTDTEPEDRVAPPVGCRGDRAALLAPLWLVALLRRRRRRAT